jgi:hypothetical protein
VLWCWNTSLGTSLTTSQLRAGHLRWLLANYRFEGRWLSMACEAVAPQQTEK